MSQRQPRFPLTLLLIIVACASSPSADESSIVRSWDYAADRAAVWAAALEGLHVIGFTAPDTDEARGEIVSSWRPFQPATGYATCSKAYEGRARLGFGTGIKGVRVTMDVDYRPMGEEEPGRCASTGEIERLLNRLILERIGGAS